MTINVQPLRRLDLDEGAMIVAGTRASQRLAVALESPRVQVFGPDEAELRVVNLKEHARRIGLNSAGDQLAVIDASRGLFVISLRSETFGQELMRLDAAGYDDCAFSRDDQLLWTVRIISDQIGEIGCYDLESARIIARHQFKPLIAGCGFILTVHPQENIIGLWACGGPDEIWNYWIKLHSNDIELQPQLELDGATPPCFNSSGDRFVVLNGDDLQAFSFPDCEALYSAVSPFGEDDAWAESMVYLDSADGDFVLASTNEARLFLVSMESGDVVGEVALEGHEPRPFYQVYRSLSKTDDGLCTDLHNFTTIGNNVIVSVHLNGRVSNRRDTILVWRAPLTL